MMAYGKKFSLVVPVLANIYKILNEIASSSIPSKCDTAFPTPAHYLNAWLAVYSTLILIGLMLALPRAWLDFPKKVHQDLSRKLSFRYAIDLEFHRLARSKKHQEVF
jgi:hypothetical protein